MIICINKERVDTQDASKMRVVLQAKKWCKCTGH